MPNKEKKLHMITEFLGVVSGFTLIYIAGKVPEYSIILYTMGIGTLIIDLYFLKKWGAI